MKVLSISGPILCCVLFLSACTVDVEIPTLSNAPSAPAQDTAAEDRTPDSDGSGQPAVDEILAENGLPVLGPIPGSSHWHSAYVVRVCDDVLDPFDSDADPLGIHSHADGLIHVHPFVVESGYEHATLSLFLDAMGVELQDGALTLPGGGTWRDGDECNGQPGRVFVDRWEGPGSSGFPERIFEDMPGIRFQGDREMFQIAFAPADSPPVVPPAEAQLDQVSAPAPSDRVWIDVARDADPDSVHLWPVASVAELPCEEPFVENRVLSGAPTCYQAGETRFRAEEAVVSARAVQLNRRPAVELTITPQLRTFLETELSSAGLVMAIEVDGYVVTALRFERLPVSRDRVVLAGGFDTESAERLADLLS